MRKRFERQGRFAGRATTGSQAKHGHEASKPEGRAPSHLFESLHGAGLWQHRRSLSRRRPPIRHSLSPGSFHLDESPCNVLRHGDHSFDGQLPSDAAPLRRRAHPAHGPGDQLLIGRLVGKVVGEEPTGGLMLDVHGVGYELLCPIGTVGRAARDDSGDVILWTHTNLRQDALELFGFSALEERTAFRKLTSVPNVGPRLAISVLNVLPARELAAVVDAEDKAKLSKVPGVGKKTAERLVLELRGKLARHPGEAEMQGGSASSTARADDVSARLLAALTGLGYRSTEAEKAVGALVTDETRKDDLSGLIREALRFLAS